MKITKQQLKKIIKEELAQLAEQGRDIPGDIFNIAGGKGPISRSTDKDRARELEAAHAEDPSARMSRLEGDVLALKEEARVRREASRVHAETIGNILDAMRNEEAPHG